MPDHAPPQASTEKCHQRRGIHLLGKAARKREPPRCAAPRAEPKAGARHGGRDEAEAGQHRRSGGSRRWAEDTESAA